MACTIVAHAHNHIGARKWIETTLIRKRASKENPLFSILFSMCVCVCPSIYPLNANRDCRAMACGTKSNADLMCIAFNFDADTTMIICVCGMWHMNTLWKTHAVPSISSSNNSKADEISANTLLCLRLHYLFIERRRGMKRFTLCTISVLFGSVFVDKFLFCFSPFEWSKHHIKNQFDIQFD